MKTMKQFVKNYTAAVVFLFFMLAFMQNPFDARATHFRYGHLTWKPAGINTVDFTLVNAFRWNGYGSPAVGDIITETIGATVLYFGDGNNTTVLRYRVISIDVVNNWLLARALQPGNDAQEFVRYTYPASTNSGSPWLAEINSCCRTGTEINNPGGNYRVSTLVELSSGNTSPTSSLPAIVNVPRSSAATFFVPGADVDASSTLRWRLATSVEAGSPFSNPSLLSVDNLTGLVTWNSLTAVLGGLYSCQIVIEDRLSSDPTVLKTKVAVDFLIFVTSCDPDNTSPSFVAPTPVCGTILEANVGQTFSTTIAASDANLVDIVSLNSGGVPAGATLSPGLPSSGNPVSTVLSWTPSAGDVGVYVVTFTATDPCGAQVLCSFTINVVDVPPCVLTIDAGLDEESYFGFAADQTISRTAVPSGGTPPYSYSWTMDRPLKCNVTNSSGDEIFNVSGATCANELCPSSGTLSANPSCTGSSGSINVTLLDTAEVCVTVTDSRGCTATDCFTVNATDARCFAGNSNNAKVSVCHRTNSTKNPWVQICVDDHAVPALLAIGDYVGKCPKRRIGAPEASDENATLNVFPNPAQDRMTVTFQSSNTNNFQMQLNDLTGRLIMSTFRPAVEGSNSVEIDVSSFAKGFYLLSLTTADENSLLRLVVE